MHLSRSLSVSQASSLCLLLTYTLMISLFAPFAFKRVEASTADKSISESASKKAAAPAKPLPIAATQNGEQKRRWRDNELLVRFRENAPAQKLNKLLSQNGAQWAGPLRGQSGIDRLTLSKGSDPEVVAAMLRTSEWVDFAEPNHLITADQITSPATSSSPSPASSATPDDPRSSEQWALQSTNAPQACDVTTGTRQTVIAVIDSGIDFTHPDLANNRWDNTLDTANNKDDDGNAFTDDLHGWDFVTNSATIIDEQGHGTSVAGVIAAEGNNRVGITGVMWHAGLMSLRVLDSTGTGDVASAVEAIDYATQNGAQVINCSWGTDDASIALREAINRAGKRGVVIITSAGNNSRDVETTPRYPASFELPNLISVASTDSSDRLAQWSNWGLTHVSIAAPGTDILTTRMGGDYQLVSGTSTSAAIVTGVAGLVKTLRPWLGADRAKELIVKGARALPSLTDKVASKGVVSAVGALEVLNTLPLSEGLDGSSGNNGGEHVDSNGNRRSIQAGNNRGSSGNRGGDSGRLLDTPPPRLQGAPGGVLPNLDDLRRRQPTAPRAPAPIPSTKCSHKDPDCTSRGRRAAIDMSPADMLASNQYFPSINSLLDQGSTLLSDSPFKLSWLSRPSAMLLQPQTTRTNVALASNGSTATASSIYPGYTFTPAGAINGEHTEANYLYGSGVWHGATATFPQWLQIDFNGQKLIDEIDVYTVQDNYSSPVEPTATMTFSLYGLTGYEVQYWTGSAWVDVPGGNVSGNNLVWRKLSFSAITTDKIRVLTNASVDGYSRITEVEAYGADAPPRSNVALSSNGSTATASSIYPGYTFTPAGAINGEHMGANYLYGSGVWHGATTTFPQWLEIAFNGQKTIDEIDVYTVQDAYSSPSEPTQTMTFSLYGLTGYQVQYWGGSSWVTVPGGSVTANNKVWRKFTFSPLTTNKIRVLTNASVDGYSRIVEVEAWGTAASAFSSDPSGNGYSAARVDPYNQTGGGVDLLSGNVNWSLPIFGLKGRAGLDLGLTLSYNSLVWTKDTASNSIKFDADQGTPSPGFRLGFPVIQPLYYNPQVGANAYLLITPSGNHVELRQTATTGVYEAADSSHLQLADYGGGSLILRPTDGSQLTYTLYNNQYQCTQIKDRNGNFITIDYHTDGRINTIKDTLWQVGSADRVLTFNYDQYSNLQSITQLWGGVTHQWATFGWSNQTISTSFSGVLVSGPQGGASIPVLTQVGLADGSRYNFDYNGYAQVTTVHHYAADNHQLSYSSYTLPASNNDCPRVTESREWAENWNGDTNSVPATGEEAVTTYSTATDHSSGQMTIPDGTIYKELYATSGWQRGLTTGTEFWSGAVKKKWTSTSYTQDNTSLSFLKNPLVTEINIYDSDGKHKRTTIDYGPGSGPGNGQYAQWGLPYHITEYDSDGVTLLRRTFTDYNLDSSYLNQHIIGLVSAVHVSDGATWLSKTAYTYDEGGDQMQATTTNATQHDSAYAAGSNTYRGNVTSIARYDVTNSSTINDSTLAHTTRIGYDADGSVVFTRDPAGHQSNISYTDSFSDNTNRNTFAYPTKITPPLATGESAADFSSTIQYNYDMGATTRTQTPAPAGQTQGAIQTSEYDAAGRTSRINTVNNGAYTRWVYDSSGAVSSYSIVQTGAPEAYSATFFDGAGRVRATSGDLPNSTGLYRGQVTYYDVMGRVSQSSNPTEINSSWTPTGDDAAGWAWTLQAYDWKGRPTVTTNPDTTTKEVTYGGCGCAGNAVVTVKDEAGRRQRMTADVFGRAWKMEVLNMDTNHTTYSTTTKSYNARDQITSVIAQVGANGASQTTTMTYDGYGRLKTQQTPAQTAPTQYTYNPDDTVHETTDGRGVVTAFTYNNRHLVTNIGYTTVSGTPGTTGVTFAYDAAGNRTSMSDGSGSVSYAHDQLSRLTSETRQFTGLSGTYPLTYGYNLANQLTSVTDPTGAVINYAYDKTGRMTDVTGSSFGGVTSYASGMQYRAWGAIKAASFGYPGGSSSESVSYNTRLQPTHFEVPGVISKDYQYDADGQIHYSADLLDNRFDRSYTYDHAGRVTAAYSGPMARGLADTTDRPYKMTYTYDEMNHLTAATGRLWTGPQLADTGSGVYSNNKNTAWTYDADGRLLDNTNIYYTYDAAGRAVAISSDASNDTLAYDGDGVKTKIISVESGTSQTTTIYQVTSSVLSDVVTELDQAGQKTRSFVYGSGGVLAWQQKNGATQSVQWQHTDPSGASYRMVASNGAINTSESREMDPLGRDASVVNPFQFPPNHPHGEDLTAPGFAAMMSGECRLNGIEAPCSLVNNMLAHGSAYALEPGELITDRLPKQDKPGLTPVTKEELAKKKNEEKKNDHVGPTVTNRGGVITIELANEELVTFNLYEDLPFLSPQNTRSEEFTKCANDAGLGWMLNYPNFNDRSASLVNRVAMEEGTDPGLLGFTFAHESRFNPESAPNKNHHPNNPGAWDYGPFQMNYSQTLADLKVKSYSSNDLDLTTIFGTDGTHTIGAIDPVQNGRLAARKLNWLVKTFKNDLGLAAGHYKSWTREIWAGRRDEWNREGKQFQNFFNCYTSIGFWYWL